jgi:hypothetical protein
VLGGQQDTGQMEFRAYLAFRPTGETLIIPFRNSIKVPLARSVLIEKKARCSGHLPLDWDIDLTEVSKDKVDHLLVFLLSDVFDE